MELRRLDPKPVLPSVLSEGLTPGDGPTWQGLLPQALGPRTSTQHGPVRLLPWGLVILQGVCQIPLLPQQGPQDSLETFKILPQSFPSHMNTLIS